MAKSVRSFASLVAALPREYRQELVAFHENGRLPQNRLLLALVCGDYEGALRFVDEEMAHCLDFLQEFCPLAHGSVESAVTWNVMLNGKGAADASANIQG